MLTIAALPHKLRQRVNIFSLCINYEAPLRVEPLKRHYECPTFITFIAHTKTANKHARTRSLVSRTLFWMRSTDRSQAAVFEFRKQ